MAEIFYKKFNNEIDAYKFLNKISIDKPIRVVSISPWGGPEEDEFIVYYKKQESQTSLGNTKKHTELNMYNDDLENCSGWHSKDNLMKQKK